MTSNKQEKKLERYEAKIRLEERKYIEEAEYNERVENYVQDKFTDKYAIQLFLISLIMGVGMIFFVFYTSTFHDGVVRLFLSIFLLCVWVIWGKSYFLDKIMKEEGFK